MPIGGNQHPRFTCYGTSKWHYERYTGPQTHHDKIHGAKFHPMDNNLIVTYGKDHLNFWTRRRDGIFDAVDLFAGVSLRSR